MSRSVIDLLPPAPVGCKWWVTVLDSNSGKLGVTLAQTKPYRQFGQVFISERWPVGKVARTVAGLIKEAETGRATA